MAITTKSLYSQVVSLIEAKATRYATGAIKSSKSSRSDSDITSLVNTATTDDVLTAVTNLLGNVIENRIISGLEVTETSPLSNAVNIASGTGTAGGKFYTLTTPMQVNVPFNDNFSVYYLNLYATGIKVESKITATGLTLAKIVNPNPDRFVLIKNDKDTDGNAYIQSFKKYNLYGYNDKFEEDTLELLRDNIGEVLADNIVGNIRLSENLKVTNSAGSLAMDSTSIKMFSPTGQVVAKFDNTGTYFYNESGSQIAKFATDEARIGNIIIGTNDIRSSNYASESAGFKITDGGFAEFGDVRVRGRISSSVFEYDKVSAVGGKLLVSNATVLSQVMLPTDNTITVDTAVFGIGDILYIKSGQDEEYLEVTDIESGTNTYTVNRDLASGYTVFPTWNKGTAIVSTGKNDDTSGAVLGGYISLDSTSQYAPFIDILYRNSGVYNDVSTKVRLGNLAGINDAQFGQLSGFGLYADNAYIKGLIQASTICGSTISGSTISAGTLISAPTICGGDICGTTLTAVVLAAGLCLTSPIICGGDIYGTNISGSVITGACIQTSAGNPRTVFDAYSIKSYDANGVELVRIQDGSMQLTDTACCCNYTYLSSGALRFHDEMGDAPYAKRICSGVACTGATIVLPGWRYAPNLQVSIARLQSYNSTCSGASQTWQVYYDAPVQYCTASNNYGYCFTVHACLTTSVSTGTSCLRDIAFDTAYLTEANTCSVYIRHRFQLWCNAECANYYAGCLCYNVCYRINGSGTWCACSYTFLQPHANTTELKTTQDSYVTLTLPSGQCWQITSSQTGLCWHDTGISTATVQYCLCSRALGTGVATAYICGTGPFPLNCVNSSAVAISLAGSNPSNVYCTFLCYTWNSYCLNATHNNLYGCGYNCAIGYGSAYLTSNVSGGASHISCTATGNNSAVTCTFNCSGLVDLSAYNASSFTGFCFQGYARAYNQYSCATGRAAGQVQACFSAGTLYQCYCAITGTAGGCTYLNIYTNQNTYATSCTLDPAGCLNWIAFGYD